MDFKEEKQSKFEDHLVTDAIETCSAIGLLIKQSPSPSQPVEYQHAPISLFPTPFPYQAYEKIYGWQKPMGILVASLAARPDKIHKILSSFLKYDPFLARLVQLSKSFNEYASSKDPNIQRKVQTI